MDTQDSLNKQFRHGGGAFGAALLIAAALSSACGPIPCEKLLTCASEDEDSSSGGMGGDGGNTGGKGSGGRQGGSSGGIGGDGVGVGDGDGDGDCDDGLACTQDHETKDGQCLHVTDEAFCLIEGQCIGDGAENPDNSCQVCLSATSATQWSTLAEGESCGFCRTCSDEAECKKADDCCDVQDLGVNTFHCGRHVDEETLVEDGCTGGQDHEQRSEILTSVTSYGFTCNAGSWSSSGATASESYGDYSKYASSDLRFSATNCAEPPNLPAQSCVQFCSFDELPKEILAGSCDTLNSEKGVESGATAGVRKCDESSDQCVESTATCEGTSWTAPMMASVQAGTLPDQLTDTWFVREGEGERDVEVASCGAMTCQAVMLPDINWGMCIELPEVENNFLPGDEVSRYNKRTNPPKEEGEFGSSSSGTSVTYVCQEDGSWRQTADPAGAGGTCSNCSFEFTDRWLKNGSAFYEWDCTSSCDGGDRSSFEYNGVTGIGQDVPQGESITRCVYEGGALTSSDIEGCATEAVNSWTNYGSDSTCPPTVAALAELAAVYEEIDACSTDNCVFWKSSWGRMSVTKDIP